MSEVTKRDPVAMIEAFLALRNKRAEGIQPNIASLVNDHNCVVHLAAADVAALVGLVKDNGDRIVELSEDRDDLDQLVALRDEQIDRLYTVLEAVHKDLRLRADPDGTVAVGASVWIDLDNAVKGGA